MYHLVIESGGHRIEKQAKNEQELWRLINVYSNDSQEKKKALFNSMIKSNKNESL